MKIDELTKKRIDDAMWGSIELEKAKQEEEIKQQEELARAKEEFLYWCERALAPFGIKRRKPPQQ